MKSAEHWFQATGISESMIAAIQVDARSDKDSAAVSRVLCAGLKLSQALRELHDLTNTHMPEITRLSSDFDHAMTRAREALAESDLYFTGKRLVRPKHTMGDMQPLHDALARKGFSASDADIEWAWRLHSAERCASWLGFTGSDEDAENVIKKLEEER